MVEGFYALCRNNDYRIGLGALYGYEKQIPEVSAVKIEGLKKFYGIESPEAVEFFSVHHEADIHHSTSELNAILENTQNGDAQKILGAISASADLYWKMLDALYIN